MSSEPRSVSDVEFIYVAGAAGLGTRPTVARDEFQATLAKIKADAVQAAVDEFARQPGLTTRDWLVVRWFEEHIEQIERHTNE